MQIRQIMDCHFALCQTDETAAMAVQRMIDNQTSYIIVIDEKNTYQGVADCRQKYDHSQFYDKIELGVIFCVCKEESNQSKPNKVFVS